MAVRGKRIDEHTRRKVLLWLLRGRSIRQTAAALCLSWPTVKKISQNKY